MSAMCRAGQTPTARLKPSAAKEAIAAKKKTLTDTSRGAGESKPWLCQVCLCLQPQSANGCTGTGCAGKKPPKPKGDGKQEHFALKPKIQELLKAEADKWNESKEDPEKIRKEKEAAKKVEEEKRQAEARVKNKNA